MATELEKELAEFKSLVQKHEQLLQKKADSGEIVDRSIHLKYDPYNLRNPLKITAHIPPDSNYPEGARLAWKSPRFRNDGGAWAGWTPFQYGDEYTGSEGELLSNYIQDPPLRMVGSDKIDSYVRRGDLVLCRIDARIFEARRHNREMRSLITRKNISLDDVVTVRDGVTISGPGLHESKRPAGGFRVGETRPVLPEGAVRSELLRENREED